MRKQLKRLIPVALGMAMLGTVIAPGAQAATDVVFTDDNVTRVLVSGSDTTYRVMSRLALDYNESEGCKLNPVTFPPVPPKQNRCQGATIPEGPSGALQTSTVKTENYDHDTIVNYFPQGSNDGKRQLCSQTSPRSPSVPPVQIARSSAAPDVGFQCTGYTGTLRFIAFAKDALTWVHYNTGGGGGGASVNNLTLAELQGIFVNCSINNWSQVGGTDAPIRVFTAIPGSGSRSTWDSFLGGDTSTCIPPQFKDGSAINGERVIREHFAAYVEDAPNDPDAANESNSIFFISVGIHNTQPDQAGNSLLGNVNGIAPTTANIQNDSFPFTRLLYNVIRNSGPTPVASDAVRRFTNMSDNEASQGWICKPGNAHSKPIGSPGAGIESAFASRNYSQVVIDGIEDNGFIPLTSNPAAPRCSFTDFTVVP